MKRPDIVFMFADQWRAHACGYAGNRCVATPRIDALAAESVNFVNALSGCPVCSPYRAGLLTGQYPLTHRVIVNDVPLDPAAVSIAKVLKAEGWDTAYIPPPRRQGFSYWKALECTHDYHHSAYYDNDSRELSWWRGYDAFAQTEDACRYILDHDGGRPFFLVLSWGPPHSPYETAPAEYRALYDPSRVSLRKNVPPGLQEKAARWVSGYYAHCSALDRCVGRVLDALRRKGIARDTICVFTSDHGDMLCSQGEHAKQRPWDESVRVPFLLRWPGMKGWRPRRLSAPIDAPDIMPTLLGLCGVDIPGTVEGLDFSGYIRGGPDPSGGTALIMCPHPFGQWNAVRHGGREYRGLRTTRYTYVRTREGPWLLYDNHRDPFQLRNLVHDPGCAEVRRGLEAKLERLLDARKDAFLPGMAYIRRWGYPVDETGTVPYD